MQNQTCAKITKEDPSGNRILCFTFIWRQSGDENFHSNPQKKPPENQHNYRDAIFSTVAFQSRTFFSLNSISERSTL